MKQLSLSNTRTLKITKLGIPLPNYFSVSPTFRGKFVEKFNLVFVVAAGVSSLEYLFKLKNRGIGN